MAVAGRYRLCLDLLSPLGRDKGLVDKPESENGSEFKVKLSKEGRLRQDGAIKPEALEGKSTRKVYPLAFYQSLVRDLKVFMDYPSRSR